MNEESVLIAGMETSKRYWKMIAKTFVYGLFQRVVKIMTWSMIRDKDGERESMIYIDTHVRANLSQAASSDTNHRTQSYWGTHCTTTYIQMIQYSLLSFYFSLWTFGQCC